ncbi:MAG: hypothetical protein Q9208_005251 [Pyrenodesmia sp. 3 TL-2023]
MSQILTEWGSFGWVLSLPRVQFDDLVQLEDLIQAWLFFGLLTEVFGDLFIPAHYVRTVVPTDPSSGPSIPVTTGDEKVLDTSRLLPILISWMQRIQSSAHPEVSSRTQYEHIAACLNLTSNTLRAVTFHTRAYPCNPWILSAIASIGELLEVATNNVYRIKDLVKNNLCPSTWRLHYDQAQSIFQAKSHDMCPHEVHRIRHHGGSLQTQHFLTFLKRERPSTRHQHCTQRQCRAGHKNLDQYIPSHQQENCQCTNLFIDVEEVIRILSKGSLPLLRIIPGQVLSHIRVEVVEATPNVRYLALSHVWADGLGNPHSNSLPHCQIQALSKLSRLFLGTPEARASGQEMLIWIDTLCCPVEPPEAKAMALSKMKEPYVGASFVLVLSASLQKVSILALDPTEICLRIFTSTWMHRLWTLQEAALPRDLWFQFEDAIVDFRQMWIKVMDIFVSDIGREGLALDVLVYYKRLRNFFHPEVGGQPLDVEAIDEALRFRSVTVPSDEPLLIAGLLSLDIAHVLEGPEEFRMQRLWSLVPSVYGGIPKKILFCRGARLRQQGFRWAPVSLLSFKGSSDGRLGDSNIDDNASSLTPAGLRVRLPACEIKMASIANRLPRDIWDTSGPKDKDPIPCRSNEGSWFLIWCKYKALEEEDPNINRPTLHKLLERSTTPFTLLLERAFKFDDRLQTINGLIVHKDTDHDQASRVISDMMVSVAIEEGSTRKLREAAYQASRMLLNEDLTTQPASSGLAHEMDQMHPAYASLEVQLT